MSGVVHRREPSKEPPAHNIGGRIFTATSTVEECGHDGHQEPVHGMQTPVTCPGEALLWHQ